MWIWGKGSLTPSNNVWPCYLGSAWYNAWHTVIIQSKSDWQEVCWLLGGCLSKVDKPGNITESVVSQFWRSQVQIRVLQGHGECFFLVSFSCSGPQTFLGLWQRNLQSLPLSLCGPLSSASFSVFSLQVCFFSYKGTSYIGLGITLTEYDGILITSSKSPFPNKATFTSPPPHPADVKDISKVYGSNNKEFVKMGIYQEIQKHTVLKT